MSQEIPQDDSGATLPSSPPSLEDQIVEAIKTVYDPEIPVNVYDMGLIYDIDIAESGHVDVKMTLTSPGSTVTSVDCKNINIRMY